MIETYKNNVTKKYPDFLIFTNMEVLDDQVPNRS